MSTDHLLRSQAPISDSGWELLDQEAAGRLTVALGARKLIDFSGPHGWSYSATNLGRTEPVEQAPVGGVRGPPATCAAADRGPGPVQHQPRGAGG